MKATKYFALVAALLAVGCTNELVDDGIDQNTNVEDGIILTLTGDAQSEDDAEARIIIDGSKTSGKYNVKWRNDDAIGLFSVDGTTVNNVKAAESSIDSGAHLTATFQTESPVSASEGDELYVYYPHSTNVTYSDGVFSNNLPAEQTLSNLTVQYGWAPYAFGYDKTTVNAGTKFTLKHPLAYVRVKVVPTDYVKNWGLKGVQIVDRTGMAKLAGDYTVNAETGELTVSNTSSSVDFTINSVSKPIADVTGYTNYSMWFVTLPWDFTGSEVWVVAKFIDLDTNNIIYVPTKYENAKLKGNAVNVINLTLNEGEHSAAGWYEPVDTRLMPGLGYAYGDQNTYLIQCKNGSTYTGGTYTPNADIPNSVKVDIRGRGDFSKIADISKATFAWFKKGVITNGNGTGPVYVPETRAAATSAIDSKAFTIDDSTKAQGYITVTNTGAYAGAPILLMIVDNKVVWSWAFWNIAADGTKLEEVKYGNYTLANMAIGQPTTDMTAWQSTTEAVWHYVHLYQWGRPMPVFAFNDNQYYDALTTTNNNKTVPTLQSTTMTLEQSIQYPVGLITSTEIATEQKKWCKEEFHFWGGSEKNESRVGVKTIFDPCPKGWRVMDLSVAHYMRDNATAEYNSTANLLGSSLTAGGTSSYWIIAGRLDGKLANANYVTRDTVGKYWTNYLEGGGSTASTGYVLTVYKSNNKPTRNTHPRATAMAVRCQKDTDNR